MAGYFAYIKWYDSCSVVFNICSGVRQGAVLWPILFAIYVDDISKLFWASDERFKIVSCVASQTQYLHAIQIWRVIRWPLFFFQAFADSSHIVERHVQCAIRTEI